MLYSTVITAIVSIGLALSYLIISRKAHSSGIVVLLYHRLCPQAEWELLTGAERNFCCPVERFEEHLRFMLADGYRFLSLTELHLWLDNPPARSEKLAVLTFDDGSSSVYEHAVNITEALSIPAAVFITSDPDAWVHEHQPRLTAAQILELTNRGFDIGAHGVSHHGLNEMPEPKLRWELDACRQTLEGIIDAPVIDLAIPLGFYTTHVLERAAEHGYRLVFTSKPGRVQHDTHPNEIPRFTIEGQMTSNELQRLLSPLGIVARKLIASIKRLPPALLGENRWMPLRQQLFESRLGPYLHSRALLRMLGTMTAICFLLLTWLIARAF